MSLRTKKSHAAYINAKQDSLPDVFTNTDGVVVFNMDRLEILEDYMYWVRVPNRFPYDRFASRNDMLIPKRPFWDLVDATQEELEEFVSIKSRESENNTYDSVLENLHTNRSIPGHFHVHLIKWKDTEDYICD